MKVYCVFWSDGIENGVLDTVFKDKEKAREYVARQNETTELGWHHEEMEVIE